MPTRFSNKTGLGLHIIKLNGKLSICFTACNTPKTTYIFHGTDNEFTDQMLDARLMAVGEPLRSSDIEIYLEQVDGLLELRFENTKGDLLTFCNVVDAAEDTGLASRPVPDDQEVTVVRSSDTHDDASMRIVDETNGETQIAPKMESEGNVVLDLGSPHDSQNDADNEGDDPSVTRTPFSNVGPLPKGILSIFTTFNESTGPSKLSKLKRRSTDSSAGDYRAYKHIFLEGYRTGPGDDHNGEGRLHIDLKHHELIWESCDDYDGGTRVALDRLVLPACIIEKRPLKKAHCFGDHSLSLCRALERSHASPSIAFSMDYSGRNCKVFGNNVGTGAERYYFEGSDRAQVAIDAVRECLELRQRAAARARAYGAW